MPTPSPYPLSLTQALSQASLKVARRFELLLALEPEEAKPYRLDVRVRNTPQKQSVWFASSGEVEAFLRELASDAV